MLDKLQSLFPKNYRKGNILLINADCMDVMAVLVDKWADLACVDPPYGIGVNAMNMGSRKTIRPCKRNWDDAVPTQQYFAEKRSWMNATPQ
ncbi:MAG: hypothetical protein WC901_00845 [Candidatus Margulisiibacteriota bacterium]